MSGKILLNRSTLNIFMHDMIQYYSGNAATEATPLETKEPHPQTPTSLLFGGFKTLLFKQAHPQRPLI